MSSACHEITADYFLSHGDAENDQYSRDYPYIAVLLFLDSRILTFFEILFCILSYCAEFVFPVQIRTCVHVASHSVKCKLVYL